MKTSGIVFERIDIFDRGQNQNRAAGERAGPGRAEREKPSPKVKASTIQKRVSFKRIKRQDHFF